MYLPDGFVPNTIIWKFTYHQQKACLDRATLPLSLEQLSGLCIRQGEGVGLAQDGSDPVAVCL